MGQMTPEFSLPVGDLDPIIHRSLGPRESAPQTASRLDRRFFLGSQTSPTDRHTHIKRSRYSVCSSRPHLAVATMRPTNGIIGIGIGRCVQCVCTTCRVTYHSPSLSIGSFRSALKKFLFTTHRDT